MGTPLANARALYLEAIRDGNADEAIDRYSGARYTQHSTPVEDGQAGFKKFFAEFKVRNPIRDIKIVRSFEDGQYVFLHVLQDLNNGEFKYVTADIFDTDDDGKLIEHWDMIQEMAVETISGHTQLDGPTEPVDLDKTEPNKARVRAFMDQVLVDGQIDRAGEYISAERFTQHSLLVGDGLESFTNWLQAMSDAGSPLSYQTIHNLIGCGDFVAAMSQATLDGVPIAVIDLFRISNGLIVEHWDVIEEITPQETWVNSGKF